MEPKDTHKELGLFDTVEKTLTENRVLHLTGVVTPAFYHEASSRLRYMVLQNKKPITIYLNTPGGSLVDTLGLYDVIHGIDKTVPITICAAGMCMSAGMLLIQASSMRTSLPNTQFMIHELSGGGNGKLSERLDETIYEQRLQAISDDIIVKRSGITQGKLKELYQRRDYFLTAKEAKRLHLIDRIVTL